MSEKTLLIAINLLVVRLANEFGSIPDSEDLEKRVNFWIDKAKTMENSTSDEDLKFCVYCQTYGLCEEWCDKEDY